MKILIYSQYWKKGGIERLIKYLIDNLSLTGEYDFSILTEDVPSPDEQYDISDCAVVYFRNFTPFNDLNKARMKSLIEWIDPDIVVTMGSNRALGRIPRALVGSSYPVVISEHNCQQEMLRKFSNDKRFLNSVRYLADINHFIFEGFSQSFSRKESIRVVPNPIPESSLKADPIGKGVKKIIHIGRFQIDQKQQDVLVRSFSLIAEDHPDWILEMYGGDWFGKQKTIQSLIDELGLSKKVFLKGETNRVEEVLSDAQVLAFPSAYEGFGLVVGEALSVGLPVVAFSECEGVNKLVKDGENGLLVPGSVRNHKQFSRALGLVMDDSELRTRLSRAALNSIDEFSLDNFLNGWKSIFEEAYSYVGNNKLRSLSEIELDYIRLVSSGKMFDEKTGLKNKNKKLKKFKKILKKYHLYPLLNFSYNFIFGK